MQTGSTTCEDLLPSFLKQQNTTTYINCNKLVSIRYNENADENEGWGEYISK